MLRDYQEKLEGDIFASWKAGHRRTMAQLVTGGGKTVIFVDIIKKFLLKGKRAMMIAHREELITQGFNTLYKNSILPGIIKADVKPNFNPPCQIASIQTICRRKQLPRADVVIIDEAHHALEDNTYGDVLVDHFPNSWILGVTATPYRLGGRGFTKLFDNLVCGPSFKDLVSMGWLAPLKYFIKYMPDLSRVKVTKGDYDQEAAAQVMGLAPIVESYLEYCAGMSGVVFAVTIEHSKQIVRQYVDAGITAAHLDANTPSDLRKDILRKFKSGIIKVISNVGIITEGFDFPDMQFVQLARPTKSLSLFMQMIGRVTRTDFEAIRHASTDEERRALVALSKKSCGIVLDNAGLWLEHGMPDQEINWHSHFIGRPKKKKSTTDAVIEIIEFVAEDEAGRSVRTDIPHEVEGLKLIEVNKVVRETAIAIASLKEFDRLYGMFIGMSKKNPKVKPGFAALRSYLDYCRKENARLGPEAWDYIVKKLWTDNQDAQARELIALDRSIEGIQQMYGHNELERDRMIKSARELSDKKISSFKRIQVPGWYIRKEKENYFRPEYLQV